MVVSCSLNYNRSMRKNIPVLGFIIGMVLPFAGLFIMYLLWFKHAPFNVFLYNLTHDHDTASKVFTLGLLVNIIPFIYYTGKRLDLTARGIFIATVLYALVIVTIKYIL